jgi:hypothetical protein
LGKRSQLIAGGDCVGEHITEQDYERRMERIRLENKEREYRYNLREERKKGRIKHKHPSTSKLVLAGMILLCVQIIFFCEYAIVALNDASAMYALIGVPAALSSTVWGYFSKSRAENTAGGIVYDTAMANIQCDGGVVDEEDIPLQDE